MNFNKILTKIILGLSMLIFVFIAFAYNTSGKPFYFVRIIEPAENVFKNKMKNSKPNSPKKDEKATLEVCIYNITEYNNGQRFRSTFENVEKDNPNFYATYKF
jgi:hypothetical protein